MAHTHWYKQVSEPLFPDILWSRPENRVHAGKLGIIGGHAQSFAAPAEAYAAAEQHGAGSLRVLLPNSLQKTVSKLFPAAEYAPSTPSGSFAQQAVGEMLELSAWADGILLAGDFGHNSETAIVLERFLQKYSGQLTLANDAVDYFLSNPEVIIKRPDTLVAVSFSQLQKLAASSKFPKAFTSQMGLVNFVTQLQEFTVTNVCHLITIYEKSVVIAVDGKVSTTPKTEPASETALATAGSIWWLQNPGKAFEALTTSVI